MSWWQLERPFHLKPPWQREATVLPYLNGVAWGIAWYCFIWLPSPELAIQRVAKRVREGGHNIPDAVVRRRYARGLANLFDLYIPIVTTVCVYDGASFPPIPIAEIEGERKLVLDYNGWERVQLHRKDAPND